MTLSLTPDFIPTGFSPIKWQDNQLWLLDQRLLPQQETWINYQAPEQVANAITDMVVRGAPAIGITAAYGMLLSAMQSPADNAYQHAMLEKLSQSRPTAINLNWALAQVNDQLQEVNSDSLIEKLYALATQIHQQDIDNCQAMAKHGAEVIARTGTKNKVYTHCNAGALATGGHGTALGVIRTAYAQGCIEHVFAGETRPWFQGARLTCWEMAREGIPTTLVTEGAAGHTMRQETPNWVIVGADRITADGSVANKIGTYNLAILAKHHGCKVMVAAPSSTFDLSLTDGIHIPIEQRDAQEVTHFQSQPIAAQGINVANPSFDVTPAELIDVIVTEQGIIESPDTETIAQHFSR
jgi:methylthioribose-1-phosphate isomerase